MSKDAIIRFRCSKELKARITALARAREQDLSDYVRLKTLEIVEREEAEGHGAAGDRPVRIHRPAGGEKRARREA